MRTRKPNPARIQLLADAVDAINAVADDKSVTHEVSIGDLEALAFTVDAAIDGLRDDIKNRDES